MPRIARMIIKGEPAVYHVMSRTALDGYVIGDVEKEYLFKLIKRLSSIYFTEVIGFCLMGNHFHLLVRMHPGEEYSDEEIKKRFSLLYGDDKNRNLGDGQIPSLREKWADLSQYVKEIKQTFSRFYNRLHNRKGFFWSERFKSVIVDNGDTLINCLAYIDLNPVRAGLLKKPEDYRWCSLGYHMQTNNKDSFLSLDFGLREFAVKKATERLVIYRKFVHGKSFLEAQDIQEDETFETGAIEKFKYRSRYFTDSGIIGTKTFVTRHYQTFKHIFSSKHEKRPKTIQGMEGIYSLKRLSQAL
jgi:putative transposase